jgi:hypothetical protein
MAAALIQGRHWQAGFWLAAAICLKVIPAFLLLYPLWRRNLRCLAGCALGLAVGLVLIPSAVFGVEGTVSYCRDWTRILILPALSLGEDRSRATELLDMTATHNQSLMALFHNTLHPDPTTRPAKATPAVRRQHWLWGAVLTGLTLAAAGWRRRDSATDVVLFLGALVINMLLLSPAGHPHYYALLLLPAMGLLARARQRGERSPAMRAVLATFALNFLASGLPLLPGLKVLHDRGTVLLAALVIWAMSLALLKRAKNLETASPPTGRPELQGATL